MSEQRANRFGGGDSPEVARAAHGSQEDADLRVSPASGPPAETGGGAGDGVAGGGSEVLLPPYRRRAEAFAIDVALVGIVFGLAVVLNKLPFLPLAALLAAAALVWVYYVGATAWLMGGQTAGKVICGLRVCRLDRGPVPHTWRGLAWSVGRHSVGYVVTDVFLVGTMLAFVDRRRRCAHDYAFASEVTLDTGEDVLSGSFAARYRAYWKRFFERYDELEKRNRWFFGPWKWLSKALIVIAIIIEFMLQAAGVGHASASAAPTAPAKSLALKATATLWVATTAATGGIIAVTAWPHSESIASLNVVTTLETVGQPDTAEIHLMHANGTNDQELTHNDFLDSEPDLFADRRVVFTSDRDGNREIYVMNADGSQQTRLTNQPGEDYCPSWSPDGTRIAFTSDRDGNEEIYVMNADGSNQTRVTTNPAGDQCPDWSPDGDRVVFASGRDGDAELYIMRIDGTGTQRITNDPASDFDAAWSPDGDRIAFTSDRDGNLNIYVVDVNGAQAPTRVTDDPGDDYRPQWAPGGHALIFLSTRGLDNGGTEVYVVALDGSNLKRLTSFNHCGEDTSTCIPE